MRNLLLQEIYLKVKYCLLSSILSGKWCDLTWPRKGRKSNLHQLWEISVVVYPFVPNAPFLYPLKNIRKPYGFRKSTLETNGLSCVNLKSRVIIACSWIIQLFETYLWCVARFGAICTIYKTWKNIHGGLLL